MIGIAIYPLLGLVAGGVTGLFLAGNNKIKPLSSDSLTKDQDEAKKKASLTLEDAKKENRKLKKHFQYQSEERNTLLKKHQEILKEKELTFQKKEKKNQEINTHFQNLKSSLESLKKHNEDNSNQIEDKLIEKTSLNKEEAKDLLIKTAVQEIEDGRELKIKKKVEDTNEDLEKIAQNLLVGVMQRYSAPNATERKTTSITVSRDQIKGRLIGKNAQNINLLESLLEDIDIIFNDYPDTITISGFNLVERNIAYLSVKKLIKERSITPQKIENAVKNARQEVGKDILKTGLTTVEKLELKGIPEELTKLIGRLKYRTSYGQNILRHSLEVAYFSALLAGELKADVEACLLAGFFHDIGKAIDHETEGGHDAISRDILTKFNFPENIIYAVYAHHEAVPCIRIEDYIVKAADAISAGRPGARAESLDRYIERLQALEKTALSHPGVKKTFAISAGRELRVILDSGQTKDIDVKTAAISIAHKIEEELSYPGKIKINVIRKTKEVNYAK